MAAFEVQWLAGGRVVHQRVEADDLSGIAAVLGVAPGQILYAAARRAGDDAPAASVRRRRFPLRLFSKEVAVLLGAGIPLLEAVATLREKEPATSGIRAVLMAVEDRLRAGESLSAALAVRPDVFDGLFVAVVASAERTGQLQEALQSHSAYLEWVETLRGRLVAASIYPLMLVGTGTAVVMFLMIYVVPRFATLFDEVRGDIPAASRALLAVGQWTGAHPVASVAGALALLALPALITTRPAFRERVGALMWSLPALGARLRLLALARLYRTLSMLLAAGVPALAALRTARPVVALPLQPSLDGTTARVERGERLSQALEAEGLCTPVSLRMLRVGERSGRVGAMLAEAAAFYDEELMRITELVTRLLNPLLMLVMGALIGAVVVLMYMPIFQLMESVQ